MTRQSLPVWHGVSSYPIEIRSFYIGAGVAWLTAMSPIQYDPLFLPLSAIPSSNGPATGKLDLGNLADPTKTPDQSGSFAGFLSAINPLQHIPVVGNIYRAITGDVPAPAARVLGGALLGGPIGLIVSAANAIFEQDTGHEFGGQILALLGPDKSKTADPAAMAAHADQATLSDPPSNKTAVAAEDSAPVESPVTTTGADENMPPAMNNDGVSPLPVAAASTPAAQRTASSRATPGRSMADYWSSAGLKTPVVDNTRANGAPQQAPVPLQITLPGAGENVRHTPVVSGAAATTGTTPPPAAANDKQPSDWVAAAMMHGLDRYREMKRREELPQRTPQVDTEL
jgi:hypothetical protein